MDGPLIKILLVEDDEDHYLLTKHLLSKTEAARSALEWATNYPAALEAMKKNEHDVYLLDYRLGARNGLDLLREALAGGCSAPIILLTGMEDRAIDLEAMKAGAADYLIKGHISAPLLERSIRYAISRNRTEQELKQQSRTLQSQATLIDLAYATMMVQDMENKVVFWNPSAADLYGWSKTEARGQVVYNLLQTKFPKPFPEIRAELLEQGYWKGEFVNTRRDGQSVVVLSRLALQRDELGEPSGILEVNLDITERKQSEEALRKAHQELERRVQERTAALAKANAHLLEEIHHHEQAESILYRLAAIVESSGEAIIGKSLQGTITSWNASAEQLFGYSTVEAKGSSISMLAPPDRSQEEEQLWGSVRHGERIRHFETVRLKKDGSRIDVSLTMSPVFDKAGHVVGASTIVRDITERKQNEAQIAASLREKEVLLKEIHHRVKNNLQIISSLLNLQSKYIHDKRALAAFQESRDRIRSMALIHERLYQSKDFARIDFSEYIRSLVPMMFRSYTSRGGAVQLQTKLDSILLNIETAVPVGFILNELVSNSLKHAFPDGTPGSMVIGFCRAGDEAITLSVQDNGAGLPKDFDLESTSSLGLHLVKLLTEQIGGQLKFESNGGTRFAVTFCESLNKERTGG